MSETETLGAAPAEPRRRPRIPRILRRGITIFILILIFEYVVVPELTHSKASLHALDHVNFLLLLLGLGLEVFSQLGYAKLTLSLLPHGVLSFSKAFRINLSALGVSHILPGGTAGGTGVGYRLMTVNGVSGTDVGFQAATQGIGSAVLLNAMLWLALIISIPLNGFRPVYVSVAIVTAVLLAGFAALIYALSKGEGGAAAQALRRFAQRLRFPEEKVEHVLRELAGRLRTVATDRTLVLRAVSWAAVNWLADAACLWVCLAAFHVYLNPIDLFVAYGVGNVLAAIPITPGGLGPVEAAVPLVLHGFGVSGGIATLAVLGWRLYNFWLPIPVGAACYVSLRVQRGASLRDRRAALEGLTRNAVATRRMPTSPPPENTGPFRIDPVAGGTPPDPVLSRDGSGPQPAVDPTDTPPGTPGTSAVSSAEGAAGASDPRPGSWLSRLMAVFRVAQRT